MIAAREGYLPIVLALLEAGADVQARTQAGYTAIMLAEENGHEEIFEVLQSTYQAQKEEKDRAVDLGI